MNRPSGDHTGDQSIAASSVTAHRRAAGRRNGVDVALAAGVAPVDDALTGRRPRRLHARRRRPACAAYRRQPSTTYNVLSPSREAGSTISSVANAICVPSGDHAGSKPMSVTRRTDSPVAPATKMPPTSSDS